MARPASPGRDAHPASPAFPASPTPTKRDGVDGMRSIRSIRSAPAARTRWDFLRKLGAVLLVLTSLTVGLIGLAMVVDEGRVWAVPLIAAAPVGIWGALQVTPEGGTSGYCDQNL